MVKDLLNLLNANGIEYQINQINLEVINTSENFSRIDTPEFKDFWERTRSVITHMGSLELHGDEKVHRWFIDFKENNH